MYRVVIVEDDRIIRRALVQSDWESIGAMVAGEAPDGQRGLEVIREVQPHLVVTDINMPFMDGLAMAKAVREACPFTRILFLTGYDDFQYVHAAMLLKADDYLLKPVQMPQLHEKAQRAWAAWEEDRKRQGLLAESMPLLQERFLKALIFDHEAQKQHDMQKELFRLGIYLTGPFFAVLHVRIPAEESPKNLAEMLGEWSHLGEGGMLSFSDQEVFLFLSLDQEQGATLAERQAEAQAYLEEKWSIHAAITASSLYGDMQSLETAVLETKVAMEYLCIAESQMAAPVEDHVWRENVSKEFSSHFQVANPGQMKESIHTFYHTLTRFPLELREVKRMALKHVTYIGMELNRWAREEADLINLYDWNRRVLKASSQEEILKVIAMLMGNWEWLHQKQQENQKETLSDKAVQVLLQQYADPDMTLVKLAGEVHVTAPYLSNLFKLEKHMNFTEYLLQLRMEKAKELLASTGMKTYEVAEAVGYMNPHYFSSCFKKYTGKTPMLFRKREEAPLN